MSLVWGFGGLESRVDGKFGFRVVGLAWASGPGVWGFQF